MSVLVSLVLVLGCLLLLLAIGVPIAFSLAASGVLGIVLIDGTSSAGATLATAPFNNTASFSLVVIPMFILMGALATHGGLAADLFESANRLLRRVPGALGVATIAATAGFAAVTGSSVATAATMGRMAVGEMVRHGYNERFASGVVASAGTLGIMIPPSTVLVIYGVLANEPIGRLLIAGIVPGVLSGIAYTLLIIVRGYVMQRRARRRGMNAEVSTTVVSSPVGRSHTGTAAAAVSGHERTTTPTDGDTGADLQLPTGAQLSGGLSVDRSPTQWHRLMGFGGILILFTVVIGGIYSGQFTPTEAGGVGALVALVLLVLRQRQPVAIARRLWDGLQETASTTSMIFLILIGGGIFTFYLFSAGIPRSFVQWTTGLDVPPLVVLLLILAALIPLGMILDGLAILVIAVPITYPVVTALGFDGIWYGIVLVKMIEIGLVTPPVGLNVFVVSGVTGIRSEAIFRGVTPFLIVDFLLVALFVAFPGIVTWLPSMM